MPDEELLKKLDCVAYAHGDDPTYDVNGVEITEALKAKGMFKSIKRTEGVSTTDITDRLLKLAE